MAGSWTPLRSPADVGDQKLNIELRAMHRFAYRNAPARRYDEDSPYTPASPEMIQSLGGTPAPRTSETKSTSRIIVDEGDVGDDADGEDAHAQSLYKRMGWKTVAILGGSLLVVAGFLAFIAFLWFSDVSNETWRRIMVTEWATRSVTFATILLRTVIGLQTAIAVGMLAALLLESSSVLLVDSAKMFTTRASGGSPTSLLLLLFNSVRRAPRQVHKWYTIAVLSLAATATLLQFTSTLLLSDLRLGSLPGIPFNSSVVYDFHYGDISYVVGLPQNYPRQIRGSTWLRNPPAYPTFGEFSQALEVPDGVDDTGMLMRAFLPYSNAQSRETLGSYQGSALVLDSRVSCQRPKLSDLTIFLDNASDWVENFEINGTFSLTSNVPRLVASSGYQVYFSCRAAIDVTWDSTATTICELTGKDLRVTDGLLVSEFIDLTELQSGEYPGGQVPTPFVFLVIETSIPDQTQFNGSKYTGDTLLYDAFADPAAEITGHGSWTDMDSSTSLVNLSMSVCYPAFTTAEFDVELVAMGNRTEPVALWNGERGYYSVPDVHNQYGEHASGKDAQALEERGILALTNKSSWIPQTPIMWSTPDNISEVDSGYQWASGFVDMVGFTGGQGWNFSAMFGVNQTNGMATSGTNLPENSLAPDIALASLFTQSLNLTGSVATALSTLLTVQAGMAYYDQMPQFLEQTRATQVFLQTVLFPQHPYYGFIVVVALLILHCALVAAITTAFMLFSKYTFLGNSWQAIAQLLSPETETILNEHSRASDDDVRKHLEKEEREFAMIGIGPMEGGHGQRIGVTAVRRKGDRGVV